MNKETKEGIQSGIMQSMAWAYLGVWLLVGIYWPEYILALWCWTFFGLISAFVLGTIIASASMPEDMG